MVLPPRDRRVPWDAASRAAAERAIARLLPAVVETFSGSHMESVFSRLRLSGRESNPRPPGYAPGTLPLGALPLSYHDLIPPRFRSHSRNTPGQSSVDEAGAPLAWRYQPLAWKSGRRPWAPARNAGGSRTHFNRVAAGRLAVWLQRHRVGTRRCPRRESNPAFDLRGVACHPSHPEDFSTLARNRTRTPTFEASCVVRSPPKEIRCVP
jgi:hypothetical protein